MLGTGQFNRFNRRPAGGAVFGHDGGFNAATDIKKRLETQETRLQGAGKVIQYPVGHGFMEGAGIPERPDIKL